MLNTWRGLMLAAGVAAIPAFAQAECPPPESLDRYAQTARDALVALDGLVPEEQQRDLEDRYTAMSILRWSGQGRDAILGEQSALDLLSQCIDSGTCDAESSERTGAGPRTIAPYPSDRLVSWANRQLECEVTNSVPEPEPVPPADSTADAAEELEIAEPEAVPETVSDLSADIAADEAIDPGDPIEDSAPEEILTTIIEPAPEELAATEDAIAEAESDLLPTVPPEELAAAEDAAIETADLSVAAADEASVSDPAPASPVVSESESQRFVRLAATAMKKGDLGGGVEHLSEVCLLQAAQVDPVPLCETIFNHYNLLAVRADPIAFLAFTDNMCRLEYDRGCTSLATYFGVTTTSEAHASAINFYNRACNSGDADACAAASDYFLTGRANIADPERARDTLYRACDLGRLDSCQGLAEFFARGVGGDADLERALELNDVSCPSVAARDAETCVAAANFVLLNLDASPDRAARVRIFTERACSIGHATGCAWHADNLEYGIGGDVDMPSASRARRKACRFGHEASCEASS